MTTAPSQPPDSGTGWRWTEIPWHAPLFAAALVIAQYLGQVTSVMAVLRGLLVFVAGAIVLAVIAGMVLRSLQRGALVATLTLLLLRSGRIGEVFVAYVVVACLVGAIVLMLRLRRIPHPTAVLTRALNTFAALLMVVLLVNLVVTGRLPEIVGDLEQGTTMGALESRQAALPFADPARPDVYAILLDGYPRADMLGELFSYDNAPFVDALRADGFDVAAHSHSNYMYTVLTMTSMLHMRPISDIPEATGLGSLRRLVNDNPTWDAFRDRGYLVLGTAAGWEGEALRGADVYCGDGQINDFELNLVGPTIIGRVIEQLAPTYVADRDRKSVNTALDCLSRAAKLRLDQPRFVFAHVPAPHLPIVFDANGDPAPAELYGHTKQELPVTDAEYAAGYTAGIQYLNGRVLEAIDEIVADAAVPPIIILFSDHGSESRLNWDNALLSDFNERFSNLFAALTPGAPDLYGDSPTPVNVFPLMFNNYFETTYPLAPDTSWISTVQDRLDLSPAPRLFDQ